MGNSECSEYQMMALLLAWFGKKTGKIVIRYRKIIFGTLPSVSPFIKGGSLSFWNFLKKGVSDLSHKKGGIGKIRMGCSEKEEYHLFSHYLILFNVIFLSVCSLCVCSFAEFLSILFFVSQEGPSLKSI